MKKLVFSIVLAIAHIVLSSENGIHDIVLDTDVASISEDKQYYIEVGSRTFIPILVQSGKIDQVTRAISLGADVNLMFLNHTLIEFAIESDEMGIAKILFDAGALRPRPQNCFGAGDNLAKVLRWYDQRDNKQASSNEGEGEESSEESEFSQDEESSEEQAYTGDEASDRSEYNIASLVDEYCNCLQIGPEINWKKQHISLYIMARDTVAIELILAQENADVNEIYEGRTPIEQAIFFNKLDLARIFFDAGASRPEKNNCGMFVNDAIFDQVISWYDQKKSGSKVLRRSAKHKTHNNASTWRTQISIHLPKVGIAVGTMAIATLVGKYLYKKYTAKNKVQNKQEG